MQNSENAGLLFREKRNSFFQSNWKIMLAALLLIVATSIISIAATGGFSSSSTVTPPNPFQSLNGFLDGIQPIVAEEFGARVECIQQQLTMSNVDVFITEPGATMAYLSGVSWGRSERPFLLVLKNNKNVSWVSPAFEARRARERVPKNSSIIEWQEDDNPYELVVRQLLDDPSGNFTAAVAPQTRSFITQGLQDALNVDNSTNTVISGLELLRTCRMRKSANELAIMNRINQATKKAIELVSRMIKDGDSQSAVAGLMSEAHRTMGMSPLFALVLFGASASFPHGSGGTVILDASHDMILMDCGGSYFGYESDISRTFTKSETAKTEYNRMIWNTVRGAQQEALSMIKPGVQLQALDAAARSVMMENGFGGNYEFFTHRLGHGIGLEGHEEPYLVRGNNLVLEEGMTFSVEPGIYIPNELGVRIEDIVVVTSDGYEVFGSLAESMDNPFGTD